MFFFNSKKDEEIKELKLKLMKAEEDRDNYRSWWNEDKEQLKLIQKEKDEQWKDIKIQVYEDVLKIEKRFIFIPRS